MAVEKVKKKYTVAFELTNENPNYSGQACYMVGSFNNWAEQGFFIGHLPVPGEKLSFDLPNVEAGHLEFKLIREASWHKCEVNRTGELQEGYSVLVPAAHPFPLVANRWRDEFAPSTASPQVHVLDEAFLFPSLGKRRQVWIYLPSDYATSDQYYPVIYMHDGQHLFDEALAPGRKGPVEWQVDETIDEAKEKAIVVAIAHGPDAADRFKTYLLDPYDDMQAPKGKEYLQDIVQVLKPYVDLHYRTKPECAATAMVGSSLGGLLTIHAGVLYPTVFGSLGVFSPSLWIGHHLTELLVQRTAEEKRAIQEQRYFFYAGEKELRKKEGKLQDTMVSDMLAFVQDFAVDYRADMQVDIDPSGKHGALYWQKAFRRFYGWWHRNTL